MPENEDYDGCNENAHGQRSARIPYPRKPRNSPAQAENKRDGKRDRQQEGGNDRCTDPRHDAVVVVKQLQAKEDAPQQHRSKEVAWFLNHEWRY